MIGRVSPGPQPSVQQPFGWWSMCNETPQATRLPSGRRLLADSMAAQLPIPDLAVGRPDQFVHRALLRMGQVIAKLVAMLTGA